VPTEVVAQHIVDTDGSGGDSFWIDHLLRLVREHDDWVHVVMHPTDPRLDYALHPLDVAEHYVGNTDPVVVVDGLVIDGSHRASAAWHTDSTLNVYIPAHEL
jgi:hypothetical protein